MCVDVDVHTCISPNTQPGAAARITQPRTHTHRQFDLGFPGIFSDFSVLRSVSI